MIKISNRKIKEMIKDILSDVNMIVYKSTLYKEKINSKVLELLDTSNNNISKDELSIMEDILYISNILYNNSDLDVLILEDGVYDILIEKIKSLNPNFLVGAIPMDIKISNSNSYIGDNVETINPVHLLPSEDVKKMDEMIFPEIFRNKRLSVDDLYVNPVCFIRDNISKRYKDTSHNHPDLVGTLDKCKYVLNSRATEMGVFNDTNVKILERDWLFPLVGNIIPDQNSVFDIIATIKYDGISVEADVTDHVISARSRGDTGLDKATDLTPILGGYKFPNALPLDEPIGIKFEAIINYENLRIFNEAKGYNYKNGRTAIIGLLSNSDSYLYKDLITLVPLQTDIKDDNGEPLDRLVEIEFLNKYYCRDQLLRYSVLSGNYISVLFQIKRYVEEAEFARSILPFMYDGVVLEFYDQNIRNILGRTNSVNKFAIAVKFNPLKKQTTFRGFIYTIGQSGVITPMVRYDPVEFYGTIHTKSTISSYKRFESLDLRIGDIIDVVYTNDVMPYISLSDLVCNENNHNKPKLPQEEFISVCPSCGSPIMISPSGASAKCLNFNCPDRIIKRMAGTLNKLGVNDISEERLKMLGNVSLSIRSLCNASYEDLRTIGDINSKKLYDQLISIRSSNIYDYTIFGALGFSNSASKTWKLIFSNIKLSDFINMMKYDKDTLLKCISSIGGLGHVSGSAIIDEYPYFKDDIDYIMNNFHIIESYGSINNNKTVIRFTGFRDRDLESKLSSIGYDVDGDSGVTKNTNILLVPYDGYNQGIKCAKAIKYGIKIIPVNEFRKNLNL